MRLPERKNGTDERCDPCGGDAVPTSSAVFREPGQAVQWVERVPERQQGDGKVLWQNNHDTTTTNDQVNVTLQGPSTFLKSSSRVSALTQSACFAKETHLPSHKFY